MEQFKGISMQLDEIIRKITEAENALSHELSRDDLGLSQDYSEIAQNYLKELVALKDSLQGDELIKAQEFAKAYAEHIKSQVKFLAQKREEVGLQYRNVRGKHVVSNKYVQFKYDSPVKTNNIDKA